MHEWPIKKFYFLTFSCIRRDFLVENYWKKKEKSFSLDFHFSSSSLFTLFCFAIFTLFNDI